ncbi:MAG: hypothetical protein FJ390_01745 [Verrucomicrobia bacterium]|nr:hypothetical protein [Verrucomicrobiota bacterium]
MDPERDQGSQTPETNTRPKMTMEEMEAERQQRGKAMVARLQQMGKGGLVPDFLIASAKKEKAECQEKYDSALNELTLLSPEVAQALEAEELPRTEHKLEMFLKKYDVQIRKVAENNIKSAITRAYGYKAALYVLNIANEYRNKFLNAFETTENLRKYQVHLQNIKKVNQIIWELKRRKKQILQQTEETINRGAQWKKEEHLLIFEHLFIANAISNGDDYSKSSYVLREQMNNLLSRRSEETVEFSSYSNPYPFWHLPDGSVISAPWAYEGRVRREKSRYSKLKCKEFSDAVDHAKSAENTTDPVAKRYYEKARDASLAAAAAYGTCNESEAEKLARESSDFAQFAGVQESVEATADLNQKEYCDRAIEYELKAASLAVGDLKIGIFSQVASCYRAAAYLQGVNPDAVQKELRKATLLLKSIDPHRSWSDYFDVIINDKDRLK